MFFKTLDTIDRSVRNLEIRGAALTNTGTALRSCGCIILSFNFEGLTKDAWNTSISDVIGAIDETGFEWGVGYADFFPGTDMIRKVSFRRFCPHCLENYKLDGTVGLGSAVFRERIEG